VIESKLKKGTQLTDAQKKARKKSVLTVRSKSVKSELETEKELLQSSTLKFDGEIKWYKVSDLDDGLNINSIDKIKLNGSI